MSEIWKPGKWNISSNYSIVKDSSVDLGNRHGGLYRWRENSLPFFIPEAKRDFD